MTVTPAFAEDVVTVPPPPESCTPVAPGELGAALENARAGDALCLAAGIHPAPVRVAVPVTIWGPRAARILSAGDGTTVQLDAPGAALLGVTVDGSGARFDLLDAAVRVRADDVRVESVRIKNASFGVLVERAHRVVLRGNHISGDARRPLGLRGDGIRLWETRASRIIANRVQNARDLVVWYSPGNHFRANNIRGGRYGMHFMYSHDNLIERNHYEANVVGVFAMYSRRLRLRENIFAKSSGAAGLGLGLKESGALRVRGNAFVGNRIGVYLDTSPLDLSNTNHFEANAFRFSDAAVVLHGRATGNVFRDNDFSDNEIAVRTEGRADALDAHFARNHFDAYAGYDLDADGFGDVPHEVRSVAEELTARRGELAFFRGTPALGFVALVGRVAPLFAARTLLRDATPRMSPPPLELLDAR